MKGTLRIRLPNFNIVSRIYQNQETFSTTSLSLFFPVFPLASDTCFSTIALGDGVIDIKGVCEVLKDADIASSTLDIVGAEDILKKSVKYLKENGL